jgi:hypothetical protein
MSRIDECADSRGGGGWIDTCEGPYCRVREYYCGSNNEILDELYACPYGCQEGACRKEPFPRDGQCVYFHNNNACVYLIYPVGGEKFVAGQNYKIRWWQKNTTQATVFVKVFNSFTDWITFNYVVNTATAEQSVDWTVPANLIGRENMYIGVSAISSAGGYREVANTSSPISIVDAQYPAANSSSGPIISNLKIAWQTNYAVVTWNTDKDADSWVRFWKVNVTNPDEQVVGSDDLTRNHSVPLYIAPTTQIKYEVLTKDSAGNLTRSVIYDYRQIFENPASSTPTTTTPTTTTSSTSVTQFVQQEQSLVGNINTSLVNRLNGYILLQVQEHGEAWYVDPNSDLKYYLSDGTAAYSALRKFGLGITNADLAKIPVGIESRFQDIDTDGDGLPDKLEEGLSTNPNNSDSDGDGYSDLTEIQSGYNPLGSGKLTLDTALANRLKGRIVLQVQSRGEAWYINPKDGKRYYMKDGDAAYQIMRFLSLGITNTDLRQIPVGTL